MKKETRIIVYDEELKIEAYSLSGAYRDIFLSKENAGGKPGEE